MSPAVRLAALVAALALGAPAASAQEAAKRYAVLVGVNAYEHPKLPALKYAVNDVTELAAVLTEAEYAVTLLTDATGAKDAAAAPTRANVEAALKRVVGGCKRGDTVVVGLAGHGVQFEGQKDAYFCPSDARPFADRADSLVSLGKVYGELDASFAGVKVLLVDACRDDPAAGRGASRGVDADAAPPPPKGVAALFSCSAGERAFEHDDLKHGVFFHYVLQGLAGEAKNGRGVVTFNGLSDYVSHEVKTRVGELIGNGARQLPNQKGEFFGGSPELLTPAKLDRPPAGGGELAVRPPAPAKPAAAAGPTQAAFLKAFRELPLTDEQEAKFNETAFNSPFSADGTAAVTDEEMKPFVRILTPEQLRLLQGKLAGGKAAGVKVPARTAAIAGSALVKWADDPLLADLREFDRRFHMSAVAEFLGDRPEEKAKAIQKAALDGSAVGKFLYAYLLHGGDAGVAQDIDAAKRLYQEAAAAGLPHAIASRAFFYLQEDVGKAVELELQAAEAGYGPSIACVGNWYLNGFNVEQDVARGLQWLNKGVTAGLPECTFDLAKAYAEGKGVVADAARAKELFEKAADQGHPGANAEIEKLQK